MYVFINLLLNYFYYNKLYLQNVTSTNILNIYYYTKGSNIEIINYFIKNTLNSDSQQVTKINSRLYL